MEGNIPYLVGTTFAAASYFSRLLIVSNYAKKTHRRLKVESLELKKRSADKLLAGDEGEKYIQKLEKQKKWLEFLKSRIPLIIGIVSIGTAGVEAYLGNTNFAKIALTFAIPHLAESLARKTKK